MDKLVLHDVELKKRNFRGEPMEMNERGDRTCLIVLKKHNARELGYESLTEMYNELKADQWAVKRFNVTEDNQDPDCYIPVKAVYYETDRSMIFMKTERGNSTLLNEDSVGRIDRSEIDKVDVILKKHHYNSHGREGYNVRIKSMEVIIVEDEICSRNNSSNGYSSSDDDYEELPFSRN